MAPMAYQLFDKDNREVTPSDLQNRAVWYVHGASREQVFVARHGKALGVALNPAKANDPTVPDLLYGGHLADLKCQDTPFFLAGHYGVEPTYAVTFNLKDALNYGRWGQNHQDFSIFYWVDWVAVRMVMNGKSYAAQPLTGVWHVRFARLDEMRRTRPIHWYNQRHRQPETDPRMQRILKQFEPRLAEGDMVWAIRGVRSNAACSYVFDVRSFERVV
ncbi:MAG: hypothetical protein HY782_25195 [Chloroflexi bacterium]|nr:hypothetical protein [Chloroflexota bacterium]